MEAIIVIQLSDLQKRPLPFELTPGMLEQFVQTQAAQIADSYSEGARSMLINLIKEGK